MKTLKPKNFAIAIAFGLVLGALIGLVIGFFLVITPYAGSDDFVEREHYRKVVERDSEADGDKSIAARFWIGMIIGEILGLVSVLYWTIDWRNPGELGTKLPDWPDNPRDWLRFRRNRD